MTKQQKADQEEARKVLLEMLRPGDTVYTVLRHVSSSGMSRSISLFAMRAGSPLERPAPFDITYFAARTLNDRTDQKNGGIKVGGCGMDMGFHIVYNLSYCLWPDGFTCAGKEAYPDRCPSCDHSNGDRDYTPHHHQDGGYSLRQRWM